jgi:hypothetical protein
VRRRRRRSATLAPGTVQARISCSAYGPPHVRAASGCEQNGGRRVAERAAPTARRRTAFLLLLSSAQSSVHNTAAGLSAETKRTQHPDLPRPTHPNSQPARPPLPSSYAASLPGRRSDCRAAHLTPRSPLTTLHSPAVRVSARWLLLLPPSLVTLRFVFAVSFSSSSLSPPPLPLCSLAPCTFDCSLFVRLHQTRVAPHTAFPVPGLVPESIRRTSLAAAL